MDLAIQGMMLIKKGVKARKKRLAGGGGGGGINPGATKTAVSNNNFNAGHTRSSADITVIDIGKDSSAFGKFARFTTSSVEFASSITASSDISASGIVNASSINTKLINNVNGAVLQIGNDDASNNITDCTLLL